MNTQMKALLARKLSKKGKKLNGFTLIELMVVVAIVGVLTAVGLPELSKAQDRAKDNATAATLTNAAKECSLSLIMNGDDSDYTAATAGSPFADVTGDCALDTTLSLISPSGDGETTTYEIDFNGAVPGTAEVA